jgi:predicted dehydrogenase
MAPDVATGKRLLALHAQHSGPLWMVAENWRYEAAFVKAAEMVRDGEIGEPLFCHWASHFHVTPASKYYGTDWRRSGSFQGGYLLDSGVHRAAVLRLILGEVDEVYATGEQLRPDLPPLDTICAVLRFDSGVVGSYSMTVAMQPPWDRSLSIVGREGSLQVERWEVVVEHGGKARSMPMAREGDVPAIEAELAAFAAAIRHGAAYGNSPQEALQDVAVVEAMLQSARIGQRVAPERIV